MDPRVNNSVHVLRLPPCPKLHVHEDEKGSSLDGCGKQTPFSTKHKFEAPFDNPINFSQCIKIAYMWWER